MLGWPTRNLPVYYNAPTCSFSESELISLLDQALATWNSSPNTGLTLFRATTASATTAPQVLADGFTGQSPLVVCDTRFDSDLTVNADGVPAATHLALDSKNHLNVAGVIINAQFGAQANFNFLTRDQQLVALTHELGHAIGLGHSESNHSLMFYSIDNKTTPTLTEDDMDGATFLYARNEFASNPFGCSAVHFARSTFSIVWMGMFVGICLAVTFVAGRFLQGRKRP